MSLDDRLKRGLPRLAPDTDPEVEPALQRVVSGGRRRKFMYRAGATAVAAAVVAGAWFATPRVLDALSNRPAARPGGTATEAPPETGATATPTDGETGMQTDSGWGIAGPLTCYEVGFYDTDLRFSPGYLPEGFSPQAVPGPAPGAPPAEEGQVVVHWTDGERSVEARTPGTLFAELAQEDDAPTITVLGRDTPDFGPIAPMTKDYIVQFVYNPGDLPDRVPGPADCGLWSLNEYGLSLDDLLKVAEGLVPA